MWAFLAFLFNFSLFIFVIGDNNFIEEDDKSGFPPLSAFVLWPNGTVPFYIEEEHFDEEQSLYIRSALTEFEFKTCLKFVASAAPPGVNDHVLLFENPSGNKKCLLSRDGHGRDEPHRILLGYDCLKIPSIYTVIMQALGFPFEHNRDIRDKYINVQEENVIPSLIELFTVDMKLPAELKSLPYDVDSVMHFGERDWSKNGHRTIILKDKNSVQKREGLTPTDLKKIEIVYRAECLQRDRLEKMGLCKNYPGAVRKKRDVEPPVGSLRVNPDITPPPAPSSNNDQSSNQNANSDVNASSAINILKDLGIESEVQNIVNQVYQATATALENARRKYCNNTKRALKSYELTSTQNGTPDILGVIDVIANYSQNAVLEALNNLTTFCSEPQPSVPLQRAWCLSDTDPRCRSHMYSTKLFGYYTTRHWPPVYQNTRIDHYTKKVFYHSVGFRKSALNSTEASPVDPSLQNSAPAATVASVLNRRKRDSLQLGLGKVEVETKPEEGEPEKNLTKVEISDRKKRHVSDGSGESDSHKNHEHEKHQSEENSDSVNIHAATKVDPDDTKNPAREENKKEGDSIADNEKRNEDNNENHPTTANNENKNEEGHENKQEDGNGNEKESNSQSKLSPDPQGLPSDLQRDNEKKPSRSDDVGENKEDAQRQQTENKNENEGHDQKESASQSPVEGNSGNVAGGGNGVKSENDEHPSDSRRYPIMEEFEELTYHDSRKTQRMHAVHPPEPKTPDDTVTEWLDIQERSNYKSNEAGNNSDKKNVDEETLKNVNDFDNSGNKEPFEKEEAQQEDDSSKYHKYNNDERHSKEENAGEIDRDPVRHDDPRPKPSAKRYKNNDDSEQYNKENDESNASDTEREKINYAKEAEREISLGQGKHVKQKRIDNDAIEEENDESRATRHRSGERDVENKTNGPERYRETPVPIGEEDDVPMTLELPKATREFYDQRKWKGGVMHYVIKGNGSSYNLAEMRENLQEVKKALEGTCVMIKEIEEQDARKFHDVMLIDQSPDFIVGRTGGMQTFGCIELFRGGQHRQHTAMMVMAMLGFYFEVTRHDRDSYVRVHPRHIRADKLHYFEKLPPHAAFPIPYDYNSATHPPWMFWRRIGKTGIASVATYKDNDPDGSLMRKLGQHDQILSDYDIIKINSVYGVDCFRPNNVKRKRPKSKSSHIDT